MPKQPGMASPGRWIAGRSDRIHIAVFSILIHLLLVKFFRIHINMDCFQRNGHAVTAGKMLPVPQYFTLDIKKHSLILDSSALCAFSAVRPDRKILSVSNPLFLIAALRLSKISLERKLRMRQPFFRRGW